MSEIKISPTVIKSEATETPDKKWHNRERMYRSMIQNGVLKSDINIETSIQLLHDYYNIRNQRNKINHANTESNISTNQLKVMIEDYLNKLERYKV